MSILFIDIYATTRSDAPTNLDIGFIFINELDKKLNMRLPLLFCRWTPGALRIHTSSCKFLLLFWQACVVSEETCYSS